MLIVKLETEESGARANQVIYPALDAVPEGWAEIPKKLEARALALLPWITLRLRGGVVTGVGDDDVGRAAAAKLAAMAGADENAEQI
ncbi:MAG: hypothetical protein NC319_08190 [Butyricicoccus sp.]|nr:hypothetical protein [Butyricicoccus sp.]